MKRFLRESIRRIEYFQGIGEDAEHDILYSLKSNVYEEGHILQRPGDDATTLFFLQDGVIEIYTSFENHEFLLEKLFRGSIINYRTFFMEEAGQVYFRFARQSILLELPCAMMEEICNRRKEL